MKKIFISLSCLFSYAMFAQSLDELKNHIMKSDIIAVKNELAKVSLNEKERSSLSSFANDIMLMRLKYVELYAYKIYSREILEHVKELLPVSVIKEIGDAEEIAEACQYLNLANFILGLPFSLIGGMVGYKLLDEGHGIGFFLMWLPLLWPVGLMATIDGYCKQYALIMGKIRCILKQKYEDAITIKQLINDIEASA